jgi:hypothetical protein
VDILNKIVNLLMPYVKDAVPLDKAEIRQFAQGNGLLLREDHLQFLMRFGRVNNERLDIFHRYGGDFDYDNLVDDIRDIYPNIDTPSGSTYFGTNFVGESFCIDYNTGKIYLYSANVRYGVVHESIDGFLLECLLPAYNDQAFFKLVSKKYLSKECLNEFRKTKEKNVLIEATRYVLEGECIDNKKIFAEHFLTDGRLVSLYPTVGSLITMSGGILDELKL